MILKDSVISIQLASIVGLAGCDDRGTDPESGRHVAEVGEITTIAGTGQVGFSGDGDDAEKAQFNMPIDVLARDTGELVVVDFGNHRIRTIDASTGQISTLAGTGQTSGEAALHHPTSVVFDGADFFVTSWADHLVFRYSQGARELVAGKGVPGCGDDSAQAANLAVISWPRSVGVLAEGSLLFAEQGCQRIRAVSPAGELTTYAGTGEPGYSGDDGPAAAAVFGGPYAGDVEAVPPFGFGLSPENPPDELYVADTANNVIREINLFSGTIETFAGTGEAGFQDGAPEAATFNRPTAVFVSEDHTVWVADTGNHAIRSIDPLQIEVITVVGTGEPGYNGDDVPAEEAQLTSPGGVYVTNDGLMYIADSGNHRIRQVSLPGFQHDSADHDHE